MPKSRHRLLPQPVPLRALRRGLGLTQLELATHLGVDLSSLGCWERGTRRVPPWMGFALAGLRAHLWRESMGRIVALTQHHAAQQESAARSRAGKAGAKARWSGAP